MKLLIIPDLHGIKPQIYPKDFDAIICIGDVCSDKGIRQLKNEWVKYLENNSGKKISMDSFIIKKIGRKKAINASRFI